MEPKPKLKHRECSDKGFDKAQEFWDGVRERQEKQLTRNKRRQYKALLSGQEQELEQHEAQFLQEREEKVAQEKERVMSQKRGFFDMLRYPTKLMMENNAQRVAEGLVDFRHEQEVGSIEDRQATERNSYLSQAEQERAQGRQNELAKAYNDQARQQDRSNGRERS